MRWLLLHMAFFLLTPWCQAQQPVFSQFYAAGTYLNPAIAGLEKDIVLGVNYRSQWASVDIPFSTFQFTYIHPLIEKGGRPKHVGGLSFSVLNDVTGSSGEFHMLGISLGGAYDYHLNRYGNNIISFGLQAGLFQKSVDPAAFQWSSQYDPLTGYDGSAVGDILTEGRKVFPSFNAGLIWTYQQSARYSRKEFGFFQGLSVSNFNRPNQNVLENSEEPSLMILRAHGGMDIFLNARFSISPNYLAQYSRENNEVNVGAYFSYYLSDRIDSSPTVLTAGGWHRFHDSFIFSLGMFYKYFRIGFSYDRNITSMQRYFGPASTFELSLQYILKRTLGMKRYNTPMI